MVLRIGVPATTVRLTKTDRQNAAVIVRSGAAHSVSGAIRVALAMTAKGLSK